MQEIYILLRVCVCIIYEYVSLEITWVFFNEMT